MRPAPLARSISCAAGRPRRAGPRATSPTGTPLPARRQAAPVLRLDTLRLVNGKRPPHASHVSGCSAWLSRPHSGQTQVRAQQAGSPPSSCSIVGDGGTLARSSSIDAVIRSLLVCALQASPRPDHASITGDSTALLFLLRSAVGCKRSASHTTVTPAREGPAPLALHPGGPSAVGLRPRHDRRPPDHRAYARTRDPGGNDQAREPGTAKRPAGPVLRSWPLGDGQQHR